MQGIGFFVGQVEVHGGNMVPVSALTLLSNRV
jgi:hypothetical protein